MDLQLEDKIAVVTRGEQGHRARRRPRAPERYGAAKAALLNTSKALSQELGPHKIRINSVLPGPVATDLWLGEHGVAATIASATGTDADCAAERDCRDAQRSAHQAGRGRDPGRVLASPLTGNVTGSNYVIDGGLVKTM